MILTVNRVYILQITVYNVKILVDHLNIIVHVKMDISIQEMELNVNNVSTRAKPVKVKQNAYHVVITL